MEFLTEPGNPLFCYSSIKNIYNSPHQLLSVVTSPDRKSGRGQKFIPKVLNKINDLNYVKSKENLKFDIEVDGGIDFNNSKLVIDAGANILVSGTTIFKNNNGDIKKNIETLRLI